jgi:hypothetical protein
MHQAALLQVTAFIETGTGLALLIWPAIPITILLGVEQIAPDIAACSRIAGAALLALGVACWVGRHDRRSPAELGLLAGVLIYDALAAVILAYVGYSRSPVGVALWPAVVLHGALALWSVGAVWKARS